MLGCTHPGELQKLRRLHAPRRQDDFAGSRFARLAADVVGDAGRALAVEEDPSRVGVGLDVEIRAPARRMEEGAGGAAPATVVHRELVVPHTLLIAAVVVGVARVSAGDRRLDEGVGHRVRLVLVGDDEGAAGRPGVADLRGGGTFEVLGLAEVRQDGLVGPAAVAELGPDVEVEGLAPHVEHPVDRARPPERPAARDGDPPPVDVVLGLGLEAPVVAAVVHQPGEPDRHRDPRACVLAARFQQQDPLRRVLGEPVGEHASGRAGADDDVVVLGHGRLRGWCSLGEVGRRRYGRVSVFP